MASSGVSTLTRFLLNLQKCKFYTPSVKYLEVIVTADSISADSACVKAIENLRRPANQKEVRSLLGLVNYYGKFVNQLHCIWGTLEELLRKDSAFNWSQKQNSAFQTIKNIPKGPLLLAHCGSRQNLIVAADACNTGVGGVLLQRYADGTEDMSKTLSKSQQNYSQIEKKAFALVSRWPTLGCPVQYIEHQRS